jgi:hypothetical protein
MLIVTLSCSVNKKQVYKEFIKPEEVAFIELIQTQEGEVISGTIPPGRRIDGPTYGFDRTLKQLRILRKEKFSIDTIKAFLGNVRILKGSAGTGLSMRLSPISKLPFTLNNLTISDVSSKGVLVIFDKKEFLVQEGEDWKTSKTSIDTIKAEVPTIIKTTTTYSITYHGKISKKGII